MDKKEAIILIDDTFNAKFDINKYTLFIRNLLNNYNEEKERDWSQGNFVYESFREHINRFKRLGIYIDPEGNEIELLIIETTGVSKLERARTSLRNFVIKRLNDKNREYALAAFYSKEDEGADWRFSFIKIEHEAFKDDKGKIKTRKDLTPAKRFSFLVGENEYSYTAQKQLLPVLQNDFSSPTIDDIENSFSIEKVTDEFFLQYKELYLKLSEFFINDNNLKNLLNKSGIEIARFTKKLLGQIVFLYFLQKKGWLGVAKSDNWGKGNKRFLQSLYDEAIQNKKNYFKDYLQFLFYEALAKPKTGSPDPAFYKRFDCKIPFLNGGLFEPEYHWESANISIPDILFRNDEKNLAGDIGTGILDVFDRYNFTIKEDEPLEKEVAVDPEMLGKVFENMLEITERKSKGAYYTPREIVHYMCQESLTYYLDCSINGGKEINIPRSDIETLVYKGFLAIENDHHVSQKGKETNAYKFQLPESIRLNADIIDDKLTKIKICDPAIGSGAFPVGLLHELVIGQKVLLPYLSQGYLTQKLKIIELEIEEFKRDNEKYNYRIKRHAIQESIYGVDIDASAIDIARLRLWLSLIVDEEDFYSIEALPNLDYKIVRGNSLIGFPDGWESPAFDKIEKLKEKYFNETDTEKKKELKNLIDKEINERLSTSKSVFGYQIDFDFKLVFSEVWHHKNGFDIVIGNPPYDVYQGSRNEELEIIKKISRYDKAKGRKLNAFELFLCLAPIISREGNGLISMIFQNSFLADTSSKLLRLFYLKEKEIIKIDSFPERDDVNKRVFKKAKMSVCILQAMNGKRDRTKFQLNVWKDRFFEDGSSAKVDINSIFDLDPTFFSIPSASEKEYAILKHLSKFKKLSSLGHCYEGEINLTFHKKYLSEKNIPGFYRTIKGASIHKWHLVQKMSQGIVEFLSPDYLKDNYRSAKSKHYKKSRLVLQGITGVDEKYRLKFAHLPQNIFCGNSANYILFNNPEHSIPYMAILNSEIQNWFFKKYSTNSNVNGYEVDNLPIVDLSEQELRILKTIAHYLIFLNINNNQSLINSYFESLNDAINYELYFKVSLTQSRKTFIQHLDKLKDITEDMSFEEKMDTIQKEFNRLYDPNHIVRNNVETLDSVVEIRIIKEALK